MQRGLNSRGSNCWKGWLWCCCHRTRLSGTSYSGSLRSSGSCKAFVKIPCTLQLIFNKLELGRISLMELWSRYDSSDEKVEVFSRAAILTAPAP